MLQSIILHPFTPSGSSVASQPLPLALWLCLPELVNYTFWWSRSLRSPRALWCLLRPDDNGHVPIVSRRNLISKVLPALLPCATTLLRIHHTEGHSQNILVGFPVVPALTTLSTDQPTPHLCLDLNPEWARISPNLVLQSTHSHQQHPNV